MGERKRMILLFERSDHLPSTQQNKHRQNISRQTLSGQNHDHLSRHYHDHHGIKSSKIEIPYCLSILSIHPIVFQSIKLDPTIFSWIWHEPGRTSFLESVLNQGGPKIRKRSRTQRADVHHELRAGHRQFWVSTFLPSFSQSDFQSRRKHSTN